MVRPSTHSGVSAPVATSRPTAIGKSKPVPAFLKSPGDKETVMRRGGSSKPEFASAAETRSRLSLTSPAGSPTRVQCGMPRETSTSTQMS